VKKLQNHEIFGTIYGSRFDHRFDHRFGQTNRAIINHSGVSVGGRKQDAHCKQLIATIGSLDKKIIKLNCQTKH